MIEFGVHPSVVLDRETSSAGPQGTGGARLDIDL
jgi:hypothetical protein